MGNIKNSLTADQQEKLLKILQARFEKHMHRHKDANWKKLIEKLKKKPDKLWSLHEMEKSGGEPDVVSYNKTKDEYLFCDCSAESPAGRRSLCFDREALNERKEHKPKNSAIDMAAEMGIELLTEEEYCELQKLDKFDSKTSSWLKTPGQLRKLGGALFGDYRYGRVFIYHNGAQSYYAARGFRGLLKV